MYEKLSAKAFKSELLKNASKSWIFYGGYFISHSIHVCFFFEYSLTWKPIQQIQHISCGSNGKKRVFFPHGCGSVGFPWRGFKIVARWIWFSSCRSTLASVVRVSLSPSWTRSGRDPGLWGHLFVKGGWLRLGWDPSGGVMFFFWGGRFNKQIIVK